MAKDVPSKILAVLQDQGSLNSRQILEFLDNEYHISVEKETVNSLLYGDLRELVIRDKDTDGYPVWRLRQRYTFEAAKGLEVLFYQALLKHKIISEDDSQLDYEIRNRRSNKTYHLDIAVFANGQKYDIEIDGFEHIRADARLSIQRQIEKKRKSKDIAIDWMDNVTSYADFKRIDSSKVFKWCLHHRDWCIKYHEELLKPHDLTRNFWLIENGWRVIRFWNFEVKDEMKGCRDDVRSWMKSATIIS